jgi:anti-sigma-K factor RskA
VSDTFSRDEERDLLAAEYALALLEGEALIDARRRLARESGFATAVHEWESRLAPMLDAFAEVEPPPGSWARIERALASEAEKQGKVLRLKRRESLWRGWAAGMTALAAGLALVLTLDLARERVSPPPRPTAQGGATLVASLASEDGASAIAVSFEPDRNTMVVTPARLESTGGNVHQLWLIAGEGAAPVSLGIIRAAVPQRLAIADELRDAIESEVVVAVSIEPPGGAPAGSPTGPVVASGTIRRI